MKAPLYGSELNDCYHSLHAVERARERMGLHLTEEDFLAIAQRIFLGNALWVTSNKWALYYRGRFIVCAYSPETLTVISCWALSSYEIRKLIEQRTPTKDNQKQRNVWKEIRRQMVQQDVKSVQ